MNNRIPPPIVALICGLVIYYTRCLFPSCDSNILKILSPIFLILGLLIGFSAILKFIKNKTTVNPVKIENASTLVNSGIFKYTRNPMYLGMLFILISISLNFNLYGGIIVVLFFYFFIDKFQIVPEEKIMEEIFGDEYVEYKKTTRRWL